MKRIITLILSAVLAAAMLVGCGKANISLLKKDMSKYVVMGTYKGVEVDKNSETFKNSVKSYYENDIAQNSLYTKREDGVIAKGDIANISYKGTKVADGTVFTGQADSKSEGWEDYELTIGSGQFIEGFEDQLIGAAVGKETEIKVTFPKDYGVETLNGQEAKFAVKINYVNVIPENSDDIAKKLKFADKAAYVADLENRVARDIVLEQVLKDGNFAIKSYPEDYKAKYDTMYQELVNAATQQAQTYNSQYGYSLTADDVLYQVYGADSSWFQSYYQNSLKQDMIMHAIYKTENLSYTAEEYDAAVTEAATAQNITIEEFKKGDDLWLVEASVVYDKAVEFIMANAAIK